MFNRIHINKSRSDITTHRSSIKSRHLVAKDLPKLDNTTNRLNIILYHSLSLNTSKYLIGQIYWQIVIDWTIIQIKDTFLDSALLNPSDILPEENRVGELTLLLSALNSNIYFPLTKK